jgi:gamma-glutamyl-gamma-aminobutyrate hydrolase PuuD
MPRPLIGIPPGVDTRERWREGRVYVYADIAYARAVDAAGGLAVQLPMQSDPAGLAARIDGLLIPGGDDFAPDHPYPEHVVFDLTDESQIAFDSALLHAALERDLPVLGICYGAQLIALAHGGTLHHHIPVDLPDAQAHRLPEASGRHALEVVPGSRLAAAFDEDRRPCEVNSLHHQAVATTGDGLRATAHSADGLIEGFEAPGERYLVGVQWHPEKLDDAASRKLFRDFVAACEACASGR